eukprot:gnl/TRDRNA2_/TRDRNA2_152668_c0_seq1.p1 gnl/TRDRNA2_/TRDRNA2_152668_c0~~gnl/TRDRNA2_/TRDRNA2_152668_c0_seq1.p1  ORF type:complete len:120 (+),score=19.54 gnl/TRDRNA2_/TRDRNA2_152668_c0_seq1:111-470(+)
MSGSPWDCICEFIRSQSGNLNNIMSSLSNQNTISDLDTSDSLTLNSGMSPLHLFMFVLLAVWGFLYVSGRQNAVEGGAKPPGAGGGPSSPSSGSSGSGSSSSGGAPPSSPDRSSNGELF